VGEQSLISIFSSRPNCVLKHICKHLFVSAVWQSAFSSMCITVLLFVRVSVSGIH